METNKPLYQHFFVKKLVTMSMDRGDREKEAAAVLLSALYPHHVDPEQLQRGFERLLESVDDLAIDGPPPRTTSPCSSPAPPWTTSAPSFPAHQPRGPAPGAQGRGEGCGDDRPGARPPPRAPRHGANPVCLGGQRPDPAAAGQARHPGVPHRVRQLWRRQRGQKVPQVAAHELLPPRVCEARARAVHRGSRGARGLRPGSSACSRCSASPAK